MKNKTIPLTLVAATLCFFAAFCFLCLSPAATAPALADTECTFTYDGDVRSYTYEGDVPGPYEWVCDGSEDVVSPTATLSVLHPSDSGTYTLYSTRSGEREAIENRIVRIAKRPVSPVWRVRRSPTSSAYVSFTRYVYNGKQQGIFPYPETIISGDEIAFDVIGNVAVHAGTHTARILGIAGPNAGDYTLRNGTDLFSFSIEKAPLTVTLSPCEVVYGDDLPETEIAFSGLAEGEEETVGSVVTTYRAGDDVGTYELSFAVSSDDYLAAVRPSVVTVVPRPVRVTFEDGEGVYGDAPVLSFTQEGPQTFDIDPVPIPDDPHVGERTIVGAYAGKNFVVTCNAASYRIHPRPVTLLCSYEPVFYGERPVLTVALTSGTYAEGEGVDDLRLLYPDVPKNAGTYVVYPSCEKSDYLVTVSSCRVVVKPLPVTVQARDVVARYGDPYLPVPLYTDVTLPYGETVEDLRVDAHKAPGWTCGKYAVTLTADAPNYDLTLRGAFYSVLPRTLRVFLSLPADGTVVRTGEELTPTFTFDPPVGDDVVVPVVRYHALGENGLEETIGQTTLTVAGTYVPRVTIEENDASENYVVVFADTDGAAGRPFALCGDVQTQNGVSVRLEQGYDYGASVRVEVLDAKDFASRYETAFEVQSVVYAFSLDFSSSVEQKMYVSVPVKHNNRHYTAAIIREDGSVVYAPCTVESGVATFRTEAASRTFFLWEDKDSTPYLVLCLFLLAILVVELVVLFSLRRAYAAKQNAYYAFAPFAILPLDGGNLFVYMGGAILLGIADLVALVAIVVYAVKLGKKGQRSLDI